jgi:long-chain fatty acid transport protein
MRLRQRGPRLRGRGRPKQRGSSNSPRAVRSDLSDSFEEIRKLSLGVAINVPFGFEIDYEDGWVGRYYALQSRLRSVDINPVVAYEVVPGLSLAVGLQAQYMDAKLSNAIDFGTLGALNGVPGAEPAAQDGFAKVSGDDWGFGYTAGILFEPWPGTRFGAAYRSQIHHQLKGDARVRLDNAGIGAALGATAGTTAAKASLTTPEIVSFGAYHELNSSWAVMADASWTRWSRLGTLRIKFDDPAQADNVTEEDWRDTWFFAFGCTFRPNENWTVRSGIGYDQSPARNKTRTRTSADDFCSRLAPATGRLRRSNSPSGTATISSRARASTSTPTLRATRHAVTCPAPAKMRWTSSRCNSGGRSRAFSA